MYLLDSDTVNLLLRGQERLVSTRDIFVSSISVEEILKGALAEINRRRSILSASVAEPSFYFLRAVRKLAEMQLLAYDDDAEQVYQNLSASVKRVGKMDCRIAAHAIVSGLVVVTRNTRDFERIPGVQTEDWSV